MGEGIHTISKGVRTDRSHLHDTDSGMNKQEAFRISQLEQKIRNRKTEKGFVIGSNGEILAESRRSTRNSATFYVRDLEKARGGILTHNHPNADLYGTMAGRIGLPFSSDDLLRAVSYDMKEVRAVTPTYTFSIRRPKGGWGDKQKINETMRQWNRDFNRGIEDYINSKISKGGSRAEAYDRGNVGVQWSAWKKAMKDLGITVTRRRVK